MRDSDPANFKDNEINYDLITQRYHLSFDPEQTPRPSMVVVHLIAHITDESPLSLPQLHSVVDTDNLDSWLSTTRDQQSESEVMFTYAGYQITLDNVGNLWAQPTDVSDENIDENPID